MKHFNEMEFEITPKRKQSTLMEAIHEKTSMGETANGAATYTRTQSSLLDFFAQAGAMREKPDKALELFKKAFSEDREQAIRILFYFRDVRGGQGERALFRNCLQWVGVNFPEVLSKVVDFVPEYGRWDDLFFDNDVCIGAIKKGLASNDLLLAKWLPTINASSPKTRAKAKFLANKLDMSEIQYRKNLRALRKELKAVEELMSANKWDEIKYEHVPSRAHKIYRKAFAKHDPQRYERFISDVNEGKEKINSGTLYPYEIYDAVRGNRDATMDALWKNLPDYTRGKNAIVVADVSGSMMGRPMSVSVSLALYFAEKNAGAFNNYFITFSGEPTLQYIHGNTLYEKMTNIENSNWQMNTDLQAVFELLLSAATANDVPQNEMPETIYVISDMEFDQATAYRDYRYSYAIERDPLNYGEIRAKYLRFGYKLPNIVFWNVNASGSNLPVRENEQGVTMVSGFSPSVFKTAVENKTPLEVMNDTINSDRYNKIKL